MNPAPLFDLTHKIWDRGEGYVIASMILGLLFLGPMVCKRAASMTRSLKPWGIKLVSLLAACGAMAAANWGLYQWLGNDFAWCAWLPDLLFALFVLSWLFTPMLHLRAGSADALDDKIEQRRPDGWNAALFRWIPSTGVHRALLTKRSPRKTSGKSALPSAIAVRASTPALK